MEAYESVFAACSAVSGKDACDVDAAIVARLVLDSRVACATSIADMSHDERLATYGFTYTACGSPTPEAVAESRAFAAQVLARHNEAVAQKQSFSASIGVLARYSVAKKDAFADCSLFTMPAALASTAAVTDQVRTIVGRSDLYPVPCVYRHASVRWAWTRVRDPSTVPYVVVRALVPTDVRVSLHSAASAPQWDALPLVGDTHRSRCTKQLVTAMESAPDATITIELNVGDLIVAHVGMPMECTVKSGGGDDVPYVVQTMAFSTVDRSAAWERAVAQDGLIDETELGAVLNTEYTTPKAAPPAIKARVASTPAAAAAAAAPVVRQKKGEALERASARHTQLEERIAKLREREQADGYHIWDADAFEKTAAKHRASIGQPEFKTPAYTHAVDALETTVKRIEEHYDEYVALERRVRTAYAALDAIPAERGGGVQDTLRKLYDTKLRDKCFGSFKATSVLDDFETRVNTLSTRLRRPYVAMAVEPTEERVLASHPLYEWLNSIKSHLERGSELHQAVLATCNPQWIEHFDKFRVDFTDAGKRLVAAKYPAFDVAPLQMRYDALQQLLQPTVAAASKGSRKRAAKRDGDDDMVYDKRAREWVPKTVDLDNDDDDDDEDDDGEAVLLNGVGQPFVDDEDDDDDDDVNLSSSSSSYASPVKSVSSRRAAKPTDELAHRLLMCTTRCYSGKERDALIDYYREAMGTAAKCDILKGRVAEVELRTSAWGVFDSATDTLIGKCYYATRSKAEKNARKLGMADDEWEVRSVSLE